MPEASEAVSEPQEETTTAPEDVAHAVWVEIEKLRDDIPPPMASTGLYADSRAADAFQAADQAVASLCAVPREKMLEGFSQLVEGQRLNNLLDALVSSENHPALQHSCLMVMCGVASLKQAHDEVTERRDVLKSLLSALAAPKPHRISPEGAEEDLDVNPAVGAAICLNSLLVSCGGLSEGTIKVWAELNALTAITSALEAHSVFEGGGDEDVLPAMLFGLATPLLLSSKDDTQQQQAAEKKALPGTETETAATAAETEAAAAAAAPGLTNGDKKKQDTAAPAAASTAATTTRTAEERAEAEKASMAARQRLAEAFLRLLAERREWVARSLAMAANASPSDLSGGGALPSPVQINNLLVNSLAHPDLLGRFTGKAPVRLRAQAVASARQCETELTFAPGFALQLARLLGLGGNQDATRRMAAGAMGRVSKKEASKQAAVVTCSRPACGKRQGVGGAAAKFKVCSRCQVAMYCSGECQAAHWKEGHKAVCKKK